MSHSSSSPASSTSYFLLVLFLLLSPFLLVASSDFLTLYPYSVSCAGSSSDTAVMLNTCVTSNNNDIGVNTKYTCNGAVLSIFLYPPTDTTCSTSGLNVTTFTTPYCMPHELFRQSKFFLCPDTSLVNSTYIRANNTDGFPVTVTILVLILGFIGAFIIAGCIIRCRIDAAAEKRYHDTNLLPTTIKK